MSDDAFLARLRGHIGKPGDPQRARDAVNEAMIRHWCDAMEDGNPVYTQPELAAKSLHGGIVAPPTMLNAWTMAGLVRREDVFPGRDPQGEVLRELDAAGFTSVVATNSEHDYDRYLRPGDHVSGTLDVVDVSEVKKTGLGVGHFVTTQTEYRDQHGERVGAMRFRILKFQPGTGRSAPPEGASGGASPDAGVGVETHAPRPERRATTRGFDGVAVGDRLAPCPIPITTTLIVAAAIASRDYQDVHHDPVLARKRGSPDIFMNILTSGGLCGRYVTDWAGPEARMRNLRIRLGAPNYPGDCMTMSGEVTAKELRDGLCVVEVSVRGANRLGDHVTGTTELVLPEADGRALA